MNEFVLHVNNYNKNELYIKNKHENININHFLELNKLDNFNLQELKLSHLDIFTILNGRILIKEKYLEHISKIPGILLLDRTYGSFKQKFFYKLIPFNKSFPAFLIAYNKPNTFNKHIIHKYILFKYKHWNNKHPHGEIIEILGDVNNLDAYSKYRLYCDNLFFSKKKFNNQCIHINKNNQFFSLFQDKIIHKDKFIFTIDPLNCKDFDDAVSIHQKDELTYINIYISDVAFILDIFNLHDYIDNQISSIYLPSETINMLSNLLSNNICSLVENSNKFCIVCTLTIKNNEIIDTTFTNEIVFIHKNFIYGEPDLHNHEDYKRLFDTVSNITTIKDSHDLVEWLMIEMNYRASLVLKQHKYGVFRNNNNIRSEYFFYDTNKCFNHTTLKKSSYLHITSPIRRLVDILNQIALVVVLNLYRFNNHSVDFYNKYVSKINDINIYSKKIKYLESDMYFLHTIKDSTINLFSATVLENSLFIDTLNKFVYFKDIHLQKHINSTVNIKIYLIIEEITLQNKIKIEIL